MKKIFTIALIGIAIGLAVGFVLYPKDGEGQAPPVVHLSFQTKADMYLFQAQQGQGAALMGDITAGDTPVRTFWYDQTSTAVDDGVNIFKPTAITHPAPGRWIRVDRAQVQADYTQATTAAIDYIKNKPTITSLSFNNAPSVTIQTVAASANGNQLSPTRNTLVNYGVTLVSTATISGSQSGYIILEICPTNSSTAGDWIEIDRVANGQAVSLAVILQSVSTGGGNLGGVVPAGYYRRLRSVNVSGTPSYTFNSGQEVLL